MTTYYRKCYIALAMCTLILSNRASAELIYETNARTLAYVTVLRVGDAAYTRRSEDESGGHSFSEASAEGSIAGSSANSSRGLRNAVFASNDLELVDRSEGYTKVKGYVGGEAHSSIFESYWITDSSTLPQLTFEDAVANHGELLVNMHLSGDVTGKPIVLNPLDPLRGGLKGAVWSAIASASVDGGRATRVGASESLYPVNLSLNTYSKHIYEEISLRTTGVRNGDVTEFTYNIALSVVLEAGVGYWSADFRDTFEIDSITFADGTTPESLGMTIGFASGRTSPNIEAKSVPEPGSMALFCMGSLLFSACRLTRKA